MITTSFQQLNPGSYLVNLSRGEAIDSLIRCLARRSLSRCRANVFVPEPADPSTNF